MKNRQLDVTCTREISNPERTIYLFDLYNNDGSFQYKPCLVFEDAKFEACWDNSDYLLLFFRAIKKNKKKQIKELKIFCRQNNFSFDRVITDLLKIFKASKQLNFWDNEGK